MGRLVLLLALLVPAACEKKESRHDAYMEGLKVEGEAERGICQLTFDGGARAQMISGDQVQSCLVEQDKAIAHYERAASLGMAGDVEFEKTLARARERKDRLESMLKNLRRMERPASAP